MWLLIKSYFYSQSFSGTQDGFLSFTQYYKSTNYDNWDVHTDHRLSFRCLIEIRHFRHIVKMAPLENISSHTVHIEEPARSYGLPVLRGWRLSVAVFALVYLNNSTDFARSINFCRLALGLFLSALETTIIATALVTISSDLGHFEKANWIVVAYFLTYTGKPLIILMLC